MSVEHLHTSPEDRLLDAATAWLRAVLVPEGPDNIIDVTAHLAAPAITPGSARTTPALPAPGRSPLPAVDAEAWHRSLYERFMRLFRRGTPTASPPPEIRQVRDERQIRRARRELMEAIAEAPDSRFVRLCREFQVSDFERDILLLLLLHGTNLGIADLCAMRSESDNGRPTFALSLRLAQDAVWESWPPEIQEDSPRLAASPDWGALSPERPLRHWRLIEVTQPAGQPLVSSPLRLDERIVNHLMGMDYLDDRISPLCRPIPIHDDPVSRSQAEKITEAGERLLVLVPRSDRLVVQIPDGDVQTTRLFTTRLSRLLGMNLYRVALDQLNHANVTSDFVRLWNREFRLQGVALTVDAMDAPPETSGTLTRLVEALEGLVFVEVTEPVPGLDTALILDVARPTPAEQREIWLAALGPDAGEWPGRLSGQFNLNASEIIDAVELAGDEPDGAELWASFRSRGRARLEGLAHRIVPETRLEDVQLPEEEKRMLEQIREQTRHRAIVYDDYGFRPRLARGLGITALFAGESGTGKTMAAEAIANDLQLDLYRIDLASVVSKYIGETEKNLRRVFDAAEESGAVLLFDEADAIFGKRSEVQDSHDRYANIEVSYLLQRMEAYEGLAILTTNMKSALDQAFLRRLRFIITFPFPGADLRQKIWERIFPRVVSGEPGGLQGVEQLDFDALAKPALTGGQIRNIAVNGAFLAAAKDGVITMSLLYDAARDELRKNGRPFVASDFAGWQTVDDTGATPSHLRRAI